MRGSLLIAHCPLPIAVRRLPVRPGAHCPVRPVPYYPAVWLRPPFVRAIAVVSTRKRKKYRPRGSVASPKNLPRGGACSAGTKTCPCAPVFGRLCCYVATMYFRTPADRKTKGLWQLPKKFDPTDLKHSFLKAHCLTHAAVTTANCQNPCPCRLAACAMYPACVVQSRYARSCGRESHNFTTPGTRWPGIVLGRHAECALSMRLAIWSAGKNPENQKNGRV